MTFILRKGDINEFYKLYAGGIYCIFKISFAITKTIPFNDHYKKVSV